METIKNERLTLTISEHGAELVSIKDAQGHEYLWQADPKYWNRHSPILFPLVCGVWQGAYRINGREFRLRRHGFARDMDFKLLSRTDNRVTFGLTDDTVTHASYPYRFNLAVSYRLEDNHIHVIWHVENTDLRTIYFQIGGHPAFNIPGAVAGQPLKATLRLDNDRPERLFGNIEGCIDKGHTEPVETQDGLWQITEETFKEDAVIFDRSQLHRVELLDADGSSVVRLDFKTPVVGIWSPYGKHAPFVCIEPWYGMADYAHYDGQFNEREMVNRLLPGSSFMSEYVITIRG